MPKGESDRVQQLFDLTGRVAIITGGTGLLGYHHGAILAAAGAHVVLLDLPATDPESRAAQIAAAHGVECFGLATDVTNEASISDASSRVMAKFERIDILINNAANNPKVEEANGLAWSRLENLPLDVWDSDIRVGLTAAFLCSRIFGAEMAKRRAGVIVNVASDLALIAPDQRLYRVENLPEDQQPVKPVTYSVIKSALLGLTRYLATYWSGANIRVNAISPGGVFNEQPEVFFEPAETIDPNGTNGQS